MNFKVFLAAKILFRIITLCFRTVSVYRSLHSRVPYTPSPLPTHLCVLIAQSYPTLYDPMDCSSPGSSVHGISQARILEWVAISFSRGPSQPKDGPGSPALQADSLPCEPPGKTHTHP